MKGRAGFILAIALTAGCAPGAVEKAAPDEPAVQSAPQSDSQAASDARAIDKAIEQTVAVDRSRQAIYGENEARSPFVGDRVFKLNAIVQRSLDAVNAYDASVSTIRATVDSAVAPAADAKARAAGAEAVADIDRLCAQSMSAHANLKTAEAEMKAANEYYNEAIFAGMLKFAAEVESELCEEKAALAAKLG